MSIQCSGVPLARLQGLLKAILLRFLQPVFMLESERIPEQPVNCETLVNLCSNIHKMSMAKYYIWANCLLWLL